jgi:hypothetical protein
MSDVALEVSYRICSATARRAAGNFYYSFWALPAAKRRSMCALYGSSAGPTISATTRPDRRACGGRVSGSLNAAAGSSTIALSRVDGYNASL